MELSGSGSSGGGQRSGWPLLLGAISVAVTAAAAACAATLYLQQLSESSVRSGRGRWATHLPPPAIIFKLSEQLWDAVISSP